MKTNNNTIKSEPAGPFSPWAPGMKSPRHPDVFVIEVVGCITADWSAWFNGLNIQCDEKKGISFIHGPLKDQAELYSVLIKIRNLGLSLIRLSGNLQE